MTKRRPADTDARSRGQRLCGDLRFIERCRLEAAVGERIGLWDAKWKLVGALLSAERGQSCRPAQDNRRYAEGMMWIAPTGAQWRRLPDANGKWNSVVRRYRRRTTTSVFDAMRETLADVDERDGSAVMIDSTVALARHDAVGVRKGSATPGLSAARAARSPQSSMPNAARRGVRSPRPDAKTGARCSRVPPADALGRQPDRRAARRHSLPCRHDPRGTGRWQDPIGDPRHGKPT